MYNNMSVAGILADLSIISGVFPVLAAWYNYGQLSRILKIAAVYFLLSFLLDVMGDLVLYLGVKDNMPIIDFYVISSIFFYAAIYYQAFSRAVIKKVVLAASGLTLVIILWDLIFINGLTEYPSISITAMGILLILISLTYFYELLSRQEFMHIEKLGLFWINAGNLFYFSLNIFLFMLYSRISNSERGDYYMIHSVVNVITNVIFSVGLLCKPQRTTSYRY